MSSEANNEALVCEQPALQRFSTPRYTSWSFIDISLLNRCDLYLVDSWGVVCLDPLK